MDICPYCGKEYKVLALHLKWCKAKQEQEQSKQKEETMEPTITPDLIEQIRGVISEVVSVEVSKQVSESSQTLASQISSQVQTSFASLAKQVNTTIDARMKVEADRMADIAQENINRILTGKSAGNPAQAASPIGGHPGLGGLLDNPNVQTIIATMAARSMGMGGGGTFTDELSKYKTLQDILIKPQMDSFTQGMSLMINIFGTAMKGGTTREELGGATVDMIKAVDKGREGMGLVK